MPPRRRLTCAVASAGSASKCDSWAVIIWRLSVSLDRLSGMVTGSSFKPAFWLRNPHAQTIFASKLRPLPQLTVTPERLELDDGDFLDLSWLPEQGQRSGAPVV